MGFRYPSDEWIKELARICNEDPEFQACATDFSYKMVYQVEAEPGKLENTVMMFLWPQNGKIEDARAIMSMDEVPADTDYIFSGKYSNWKAVVRGEVDPFRAMMTKKIKVVKGNQLKLMKQVKPAMKLMNNCKAVDSEFA